MSVGRLLGRTLVVLTSETNLVVPSLKVFNMGVASA